MAVNATGGGALTTEFNFGLPADSPALASKIVHTETIIRAAVHQAVTHEHYFTITGTEFVNDLLRMALATPTPTMRFRLGLKFENRCEWQPWQKHVIVSHATLPESRSGGSGFALRMETADPLYIMGRGAKVRARKGKISAIVEQIAGENGLDSVVEPTVTEGVYIQSFLSDADFIRRRLLPRAFSKKNAAQYLLFIRDGVLHFHPPDSHARLHAFDYHASSAFKIVTAEHAQQLFDQGGAGVRFVVHNPYSGETTEMNADPQLTLRCAKALYPTRFLEGGERNEFYHLSQNGPKEVAALAQNVYDNARAGGHHLELTFTSFVDMDVGDFLELVHNQTDEPSPFGGLYQIVKATHRIKDMAMVSTYVVQRGETVKLRSDFYTKNVNVSYDTKSVAPSLEAPGRDLNRSELKGGALSTGGGNQTSATLVREVTDANALPTGEFPTGMSLKP